MRFLFKQSSELVFISSRRHHPAASFSMESKVTWTVHSELIAQSSKTKSQCFLFFFTFSQMRQPISKRQQYSPLPLCTSWRRCFEIVFCRVEDEAILDRGASFVKHVCDEEEVEGERSLVALLPTPPPPGSLLCGRSRRRGTRAPILGLLPGVLCPPFCPTAA